MDRLDDSMSLRRSSRRSITLDTTRKSDHIESDHDSNSAEVSSAAVRLGKRGRGEGSNPSGGDSTANELRISNKSDMEQERSGRTKRRRASESGRPTRKFLYSKRLRHSSGTGHKGQQDRSKFKMEPIRRSTREKRLVFATLNMSEIDKQILDPKHDYPADADSSEEEMEPYEKLFSPKRVVRQSTRLRQKLDSTSGEGISKKVKEEMLAEGEGKDEDDDGSEREESEEGEEEDEDEGDEEEGDNSEEEQLEDEAEMTYNLRKRRPVIYQYQPVIQVVEDDTPPKRRRPGRRGRGQASYHTKARSLATRAYQPRRKTSDMRVGGGRKRQVQRHGDSSTTSSGSDSDEARFRRRKARSMAKGRAQCLPMNFAPDDLAHGAVRDRVRIGASLADIDPMNIDRAVTFDSVGGLQHHLRSLKEMIIFPLLYPEVFERFKINPPRGVLFYGPPGCGKTLVARALANECSKGGKKVAFFMRKGADCLSKWIGESERQLRLLFDQAYQLRPSIIFFDEIDGLAPVRSSRQDQIHSSIVSTLLALMDGLDSRGEVVVIGATNRIDAIDPALRRPGRFDREFLFPLPSREDRHSILSIHTRAWRPQLKPEFLSELADSSVGYCGADLRALCTEAALFALRRKYPQIYKTTDKLVLDVASINVAASDFHNALKVIVPTAQRSDASTACSIPEHVRPLLLKSFNSLLSLVSFAFPPSWKSVSRAAKDVKILTTFEDSLVKEMNVALLETEDAYGKPADTNSSVTISSRNFTTSNPSGRGKKSRVSISPSNGINDHLGHRVNRTKTRKSQEGYADIWPSAHHQKDGPSSINWSGGFTTGLTGKDHSTKASQLKGARDGENEEFCDLFSQLYQSSEPSQLDEVYFDMKDVTTDEVEEVGVANGRSILMDCESMETQGSTTSREDRASVSETTSQQESSQLSRISTVSSVFSQRYLSLTSHPHTIPMVHRPRLILCGAGGMGQSSFLSPALLHILEEFPVKTLDLTTVFATSTKTPEEACTQVFREARRIAPSIVYLPRINTWWEVTPETFRATLFSVVYSLPATTPLLVLATAECPFSKLPIAVKELFKQDCSKVFTVQCPSLEERKRFFYDVLMKKPAQLPPPKPKPIEAVELECLPVAPPPKPRELTEVEVDKIDKQREAVLRELRVFLRDATNKLLAERKFKEFAKPVDPEEVPDYYKIISEPMDLGAIMKKIDEHRYTTPKQWISDVDLVTKNALEYNPENDSESRLLRHRAVALQDMAHSFLDHELSEDFEQQCNEIAETYKRLGKDPSLSSPLKKWPNSALNRTPQGGGPSSMTTSLDCVAATSIKSELYDAPRRSLRQKGLVPEQGGFPYYSPTRPKRVLHEDKTGNDEGESEGMQGEGEMYDRETSKDSVTMMEEDQQEQRRTTSSRACKTRGRRSHASESSEPGKDKSPQEQPAKSDTTPPSSSATLSSVTPVNAADKEGRVLNNTHAKRQIMRPWEDKNAPAQATPPAQLPTAAKASKPLQNGPTTTALSSSTAQKKGSHLKHENHIANGDGEVKANSTRTNSVQEAAEALVEISQVASSNSQEQPVENMDIDSYKSTLSINSVMDTGSASGSSAPLDVHVQRPKEVVLDRQRQLGLFNLVSEASRSCSVEQMDRLHSTFEHLVFRHRMSLDKHKLIEDLELAAKLFFQTCSVTSPATGSEH